jgi:uncharacterized protein YdaU (DUF1376 family)
MPKDGPAFQLYVKDILVSTAHMSPEAFGGYMRLLCHQWDRGGIPDNTEMHIALTGCTVDTIAEFIGKFPKSKRDGLLRNKRLEKVRAEQRRFRASRSRNAASRWKKDSNGDASALQVQSTRYALHTPTSTPISIEKERGAGIPKDEAQAAEWASMDGVPPEFAKQVFNQANGRSWLDGAGQPIDKFRNYVKYRWSREQSEQAERKTTAKPEPIWAQERRIREQITECDTQLSKLTVPLGPLHDKERAVILQKRNPIVNQKAELAKQLQALRLNV